MTVNNKVCKNDIKITERQLCKLIWVRKSWVKVPDPHFKSSSSSWTTLQSQSVTLFLRPGQDQRHKWPEKSSKFCRGQEGLHCLVELFEPSTLPSSFSCSWLSSMTSVAHGALQALSYPVPCVRSKTSCLPVTNLKEGGKEGGRITGCTKSRKHQQIHKTPLLSNFSHMKPVLNLVKKIFWSQRLMPTKLMPGQSFENTTFLRTLWKQESHNSHPQRALLRWGVRSEKCYSHPKSASCFRHSLCLIEHIYMDPLFIPNGHLSIWTSLLTVFSWAEFMVSKRGDLVLLL